MRLFTKQIIYAYHLSILRATAMAVYSCCLLSASIQGDKAEESVRGDKISDNPEVLSLFSLPPVFSRACSISRCRVKATASQSRPLRLCV
jgi:hypothetical protein